MKKLWQSKTIWASLALAVLGGLEHFEYTSFLSESNAGLVTLVIGLVMGVLRKVTKTAV